MCTATRPVSQLVAALFAALGAAPSTLGRCRVYNLPCTKLLMTICVLLCVQEASNG